MHHDINFTEPIFYVPGHLDPGRAPVILDAAIRDGGGEYRGTYMQQSLSDVRKTYPDARIGELKTVMEEKRLFANITAIYCRLGARYFRFNDGVTMRHAHIVDHVQRKIAA